ncbi:MAG TPA: VCBS domain-containing protein, partial [Prochlorococcaceae cyanobacterium Fu_MAG_50]|nr:VCBS domain-containing protein [Prochlorococcaceae cyanobacterium Fu_MAG_50]
DLDNPETIEDKEPTIEDDLDNPETIEDKEPTIEDDLDNPETIKDKEPTIEDDLDNPETIEDKEPTIQDDLDKPEPIEGKEPTIQDDLDNPEPIEGKELTIQDDLDNPEPIEDKEPTIEDDVDNPEPIEGTEPSDETPHTTDSPEQSPGLSLSAITPGSIDERKHNATLSSSNLIGKLSSSIDQTDSITYAIAGGSISKDGTTSLIGKYGTLVLNTKSGSFAYEPDRRNIETLSAKQTKTDAFTMQASDSQGNTVNEIFTVNISGADDLKLININSSDQRSARTQHYLPIISSQNLGTSTPHFEAPEGISTEQGLPVDFSNLIKPVNQLITTAISGNGMIKDHFSSDIKLNITGVYFNSGAGDDLITGTAFNDFLRCGAGDDDVDAGHGDDIVRLGSGNDHITLGAGDDIIYLTADQLQGKSSNRIADFNSTGNDQIIIEQRLEDYITIQDLGTTSIKLTLTGPEEFVGMGGITTLISDTGVFQASHISFA